MKIQTRQVVYFSRNIIEFLDLHKITSFEDLEKKTEETFFLDKKQSIVIH